LATVGITFKLVELLLKDKMTEILRRNFLELVALATLADMMPQINENKILIEEGLESLKNSWRPAFQAFSKIFDLPREVSKIISILNVRDIEENLPASFRLLVEPDFKKAESLIEKLLEKSKGEKVQINKILEEIENKIVGNEKIIFEGSENWSFSLISALPQPFAKNIKNQLSFIKNLKKKARGQ
jgi:single-stranded-DNA-specific exonuclease